MAIIRALSGRQDKYSFRTARFKRFPWYRKRQVSERTDRGCHLCPNHWHGNTCSDGLSRL